MSRAPIRYACRQINESNAISHSIYCGILWLSQSPPPVSLSSSPAFSIICFFSLFIYCGLDCSFLLPVSCCVCLCVFLLPPLSVCIHKHQSTCVRVCVRALVCVYAATVHASLWDALISAHRGSAPSCPRGWLLIETNQACDGPIAVTPHPSHPRPNHLLIGPRRAPLPLARKVNLTSG